MIDTSLTLRQSQPQVPVLRAATGEPEGARCLGSTSPATPSIIWHNQQVLQLCLEIDPDSFYFSFLLDPTLVQPCYLLGLCSSFCPTNPHSFPLREAQGCLSQVSSLLCSRALHGSLFPRSKSARPLSAHKTLPALLGHLPALTSSHSHLATVFLLENTFTKY